MSELHHLLAKQLSRCRKIDQSLDIDRLCQMVSAAYDEADQDRRRTDHSIKMMVEELDHRAEHDALTGLANRTRLTNQLQRALGPDSMPCNVAVLFLDLDFFKEVNDTMGHPIGDELLRQVARRLTDTVGARGMVARFGGDEFCAVLWNYSKPDDVAQIARAMVANLSAPYNLDQHRATIGCSVGIALSPEHGRLPNDLLRRSDMALYRAKQAGRGRFAFFEKHMDASLLRRKAIEHDLRDALANGRFELYFQPIIEASSGATRSYEALVRMIHAEHGVISPAEFIPIAESNGLIVPLGEWVLRNACEQARAFPEGTSIAVNLSPVQIRAGGLVDVVKEVLRQTGFNPAQLELEITESVLLQEDSRSLAVLEQLRALGIRFALDDFGTGHSSLSYLQSFHFDKIKIDRSFCSSVNSNPLNAALVRAVAGIGRDLGIDVVAEGVETELESDLLVAEGCGFLQGYYYGRPAPLNALESATDAAVSHLKSAAARMRNVSAAQTAQPIVLANVVPMAKRR